jgi:hypothetical protein
MSVFPEVRSEAKTISLSSDSLGVGIGVSTVVGVTSLVAVMARVLVAEVIGVDVGVMGEIVGDDAAVSSVGKPESLVFAHPAIRNKIIIVTNMVVLR